MALPLVSDEGGGPGSNTDGDPAVGSTGGRGADQHRAVVLERWTTAGDHDAYVAWRATPEGAANALAAVLVGPPVTRTFGRTLDLG